MHFYVDESGHTGTNLFDDAQPMLYYGVLSSKINVDVVAAPVLASLRKVAGVPRLHANELGNGKLALVALRLCSLQKTLGLRFDLYRVAKPDHAIISFFDQVFDVGMNPAMTWTGYWTPLRYPLLIKLATLFDKELARAAWDARISVDDAYAEAGLINVCDALIGRLNQLPDARSRQVLGDALRWAASNPAAISYNVSDRKSILQISPNIIGFQSVMHGIAARMEKTGSKATQITVDQQSQFNKAQKTLADFYADARAIDWQTGPGLPKMNLKNMPTIPIRFASSMNSAGLELVDIHLWIFKRAIERKELASDLYPLINAQVHRGRTDEISLRAVEHRWAKHFDGIPEVNDMSDEQIAKAKEILRVDEERRLKFVESDRSDV